MASAADFERAAGTVFTISASGRQFSLELTQVRRIEASPRDGGGFTLLFKGPREVRLPQAVYRFSDTIADDIFIVPVSVDAMGGVQLSSA